MNQPTHAALSAREMQQLAVAALDELLSLDLPALGWMISQHYSRPELSGQVTHDETSDDERRADVQRWATVLKTKVIERRAFNNRFTTVRAIGKFENVTVTVWAQVDFADEAER